MRSGPRVWLASTSTIPNLAYQRNEKDSFQAFIVSLFKVRMEDHH